MDALAFSGPDGIRRLAVALRDLSTKLEAGSVSLYSVDTGSAIHIEDACIQHIAIAYILPEGVISIHPPSASPRLN